MSPSPPHTVFRFYRRHLLLLFFNLFEMQWGREAFMQSATLSNYAERLGLDREELSEWAPLGCICQGVKSWSVDLTLGESAVG